MLLEEYSSLNTEDYPQTIPRSFTQDIAFPLQQLEAVKAAGGRQLHVMEKSLCKIVWTSLQKLNLFDEQNFTLAQLMAKNKINAFYERWMRETLSILCEHHYLKYDGQIYTVIYFEQLDDNHAWASFHEQKKIWEQDPNKKAPIVLVEACLRSLADILSGNQLATDVLFPNASLTLVENLYKGNTVSDLFNHILAKTLVACIQERLKKEPNAQIRILEVGAGTGGTTAIVLPELHPFKNNIAEYCYTDLSKFFLFHAKESFVPKNPFVTTKLFNVEKSIAEQNIDKNYYDFAIATNVLHATQNIRQTLINVKASLRKHGLLLINEMSQKSVFMHLTFGLTEGWWLYKDTELRIQGSPGLYPEMWETILKAAGFQSVFFPVKEAIELGQQVILAES
jgi:SAM-dependent methyltransferase